MSAQTRAFASGIAGSRIRAVALAPMLAAVIYAAVPSLVAAVLLVGVHSTAFASSFSVLHRFQVDPNQPDGVIQGSDGNFYGTTTRGGTGNLGTVFMMTPAGVITILHSFVGGMTDGAIPTAGLVRDSDGTLYGTTSQGGQGGLGTVFKLSSGGTLTILHHFLFSNVFGYTPNGGLIKGSDGKLYGTTVNGGSSSFLCLGCSDGTVFRLDTVDGSTFETLWSFGVDPNTYGAFPNAGVIQGGDGRFYGTTTSAGAHTYGTVFAVDVSTNPATLTVLDSFDYGTTGAFVVASLVQDSLGVLYGVASSGGPAPCAGGTVFKVTTSSALAVLHAFACGEPFYPNALLLSAGVLYGTGLSGGGGGLGVVFSLDTGGVSLGIVHSFASGEGIAPQGGLIAASGLLYGTTQRGGDSGRGVVFNVTPDGNTYVEYPFPGTDGNTPFAGLIQASDGNFYGTTSSGGANNFGTVFRMDQSTGAVTIIHSFAGGFYGADPEANLLEIDGTLYGVTAHGGDNNNGTIFMMDLNGNLSGLFVLPDASESIPNGSTPLGALILGPDGALYGTTRHGGDPNIPGGSDGSIFRVTTDLESLTTLYTFPFDQSGDFPPGREPAAALLLASDGSFYGTTANGGLNGAGTAFRMTTDGTATGTSVSVVHQFTQQEGSPLAPLLQGSDGNLYGTTAGFEDASNGIVFKMNPANGSILASYQFQGQDDGCFPEAGLIQATDGNFYGTTPSCGQFSNGTIFKFTGLGGFSVEYSFADTDGVGSAASLVQGADRKLYGTLSQGGCAGCDQIGGAVFRFDAGIGGPLTATTSISSVAQGVTTTIVITGDDLAQFKFTGPGADSTIDFGPGITIVSITQSADRKTVTVKIKVAANAPLGPHDIVITKGTQTFTMAGALTVDAPPTVLSAGTGPNGTDPLQAPSTGVLKAQQLIVKGTGFQAPTTVPSNLLVSIAGTGITVNSVAFGACSTDTTPVCQLLLDVAVAAGAGSTPSRAVTVTNPDLGTGTSSAEGSFLAVVCCATDAPVGLLPKTTTGTATLPPSPTVSKINPSAAPIGALVTITGTKFSATIANDFVTFSGPQNSRVLATITRATTSALTVQVPATAQDGFVIVAVSGAEQSTSPNPLSFTVTSPVLTAAEVNGQPARGKQGGNPVTIDLFGSKFQQGATVSFTPSASGELSFSPTATFLDSTHLQVTVQVSATAQLGLRQITVTNPNNNGSSSLDQGFEVILNSDISFSLERTTGATGPVAVGDFLPSVEGVQVTLNAAGQCTGASITPTVYLLHATLTSANGAFPDSLTFALTSSNLPGTNTNDDCELSVPAAFDFSVSPVGVAPSQNARSQAVTALNDGRGVYTVQLASWDWGGSVHVNVVDSSGQVGGSLTLPINGETNGPTKTVADGLTDFEKFRGVYLVAPAPGNTGPLYPQSPNLPGSGFVRLDPTMRNLFVRGRGFQGDLTLSTDQCGVDSTTVPPTPQPASLLAPMPCPFFQLGGAFAEAGVKVWDVTASFGADGQSVFPTRSFADPTKPMLDLLTISYDTKNCAGGANCDHTSKLGSRQWNFPTLGFSTFGSCCVYGNAVVIGRAVRAYFLDRPYLHQFSPPNTFLPPPVDNQPGEARFQLAPITLVCDKSTTGADNGTVQSGECQGATAGIPGGDVYRPGQFDQGVNGLSAMDSNTDGCVELPFVADPTTLRRCNPTSLLPTLDTTPATFPQANFMDVMRQLITHEAAHATGINIHTGDTDDLMYMYSINWIRAGHFAPQSESLIQIHNKGQQ